MWDVAVVSGDAGEANRPVDGAAVVEGEYSGQFDYTAWILNCIERWLTTSSRPCSRQYTGRQDSIKHHIDVCILGRCRTVFRRGNKNIIKRIPSKFQEAKNVFVVFVKTNTDDKTLH